ncbi:alpha/beta fold hydrolase [Mycobacterium simiae]|uniref:alpha/beta fold hydrolase n=1 Tax=Mycobacterium simiae TaxID=1784 RepID=UPI00260EDD18|nr:alpha/beta hydrolase [Mycobacterium simiae]
MSQHAAALLDLVTRLPELTADDSEWRARTGHWCGAVTVKIGTDVVTFAVDQGRLHPGAPVTDAEAKGITLTAPAELWAAMIEPTPPPFLHDLFGAAYHGFAIEGDQEEIAQCAPALRRLLDLLRGAANPSPAVAWAEPPPHWDSAVGRYLRLPIEGVEHRVYIEEAGTGIPVLLQHTAGADGRQWRHLLADPELTQRFRFIAYDLPFHGKSLPPTSTPWWSQPYRLTRDFLMSVPLAVATALNLRRPVFMGCSIGGHLAVDLAYYHPESFCAVIGLESAARQETELDLSLLNHPRVSNDFKAALMYGLTSPTAPEALRRETAFVYSQGAPPTFQGDLHYWQVEHDLRGLAEQIDTTVCAVHLLSGEYDWATPTSLSAQLAEQIPGATFQVMSGLGHFPMSEDPHHFLSYLRPVLNGIAATSTPATRNQGSSV